jgi:formate hydrogenlyase subunit 3/multisubunit Na+/H+ antiporter MnhD subunit
MNENRMMKQIGAIFSVFMVFFYIGIGIFLIFYFDTTKSNLDRTIFIFFGCFCIFYGLYRAYTTYVSIVKLFFRHDDED